MHETRASRILMLMVSLGLGIAVFAASPYLGSRTAWAAEDSVRSDFPEELLHFQDVQEEPLFKGAGPGHWDVKIRERGWIMQEGDQYYLWYTGYDGTKEGIKRLGLATSPDGLHWTRHPNNPLLMAQWVEDMTVLKLGNIYYMFAEGEGDRAQLLTSEDRVSWTPRGTLDIRKKNGDPIEPGPFGTPTVWVEQDNWYLFYERKDKGVWLAGTKDLKFWTNLSDEPVLVPGPEEYDRELIAFNQVFKHNGKYYASYHASRSTTTPSQWTNNLAVSTDLLHWKKSPFNPLTLEAENRSSGIYVPDGKAYRFYTLHPEVKVQLPASKGR